MTKNTDLVVIGGGYAGARAAERLRPLDAMLPLWPRSRSSERARPASRSAAELGEQAARDPGLR